MDDELERYRALKTVEAEVRQAALERRWRWILSEGGEVMKGLIWGAIFIAICIHIIGPAVDWAYTQVTQ